MASILKCPDCGSLSIRVIIPGGDRYQCNKKECAFSGSKELFIANQHLTPAQILEAAAKTFAAKNKEYGENWRRVGPTLMALFGGESTTLSSEKDHERFHILMLIVVKLTRYVVNWEKGGHKDSIHDAAVYAAMLEAIDDETKD